MKRLVLIFALSAPAIFGQCPGFAYYKIGTIPHTQVGGSLTNYLMWFSLSDPDLRTVANGGKVQNASGYDIIFGNSTGKTLYSFESAGYNAAGGTLYGFVQLPSLNNSTDTQFEICFGNSNIRGYQGQPLTGSGSLWTNYASVWHFYNGSLADSSPSHNNLTAVNTPTFATDFLGGTYSFTAAYAQDLTASNPFLATGSKAITVSMWLKTTSGPGPYLDTRTNGGANNYVLGVNGAGNGIWTRNGYAGMTQGSGLTNGQWHYLVGSGDSVYTAYFYIDGTQYVSAAGGGNMSLVASTLNIGCNYLNACGTGEVAEVRLSAGQAVPAVLQTDINSQKPGSTFVSWGSTQTAPYCPTAVCTTGKVSVMGSGALAPSSSGALVLTPSSTTVSPGQTISITSNHPVHPSEWGTLAGTSGSVTPLDLFHAAYTAPSHLSAPHAIGGCPVSPADSILSSPITNAPVHSQSNTWLAFLETQFNGSTIPLRPEIAWAPNILATAPSMKNLKFFYGSGKLAVADLVGSGIYAGERETGWDNADGQNTDHHTWTVDTTQCQFYDTYNDQLSASDLYNCNDLSAGCNATSGISYSSTTYNTTSGGLGGTDAAGLPMYLIATLQDIEAGGPFHPGRFTLGAYAGSSPMWPAIAGSGGTPLQYGMWLRLKAGYTCSSCSSLTPAQQTYANNLLNWLKNYGVIYADVGSQGVVDFSHDIILNPDAWTAMWTVMSIPVTRANFDVIDVSSLKQSGNSYRVNPNVAASMGALVSGTAGVSVLDSTGSTGVVALTAVPITVGVKYPRLPMLVNGTPYSYQLSAWVKGTSNQAVTYTLASGPGSVNSSGLYTGPATVSGPTAVKITIASVADPSATVTQGITLYPVSSDGDFRSISGPAVKDGNGYVWGGQTAISAPGSSYGYDIAPKNVTGTEASVYAEPNYQGGDWQWRMIVPPGSYKIRFLMNSKIWSNTDPMPWDDLNVVVNGQVLAHKYHWGAAVNYSWANAWDQFYPVTVNAPSPLLTVSLGPTVPDRILPFPGTSYLRDTQWREANVGLSALEVIPVASPTPSISIDTGMESWAAASGGTGNSNTQSLTVLPGSTTQLYAVGWYMTNSVTWSVSGGGSISSSGVYTAPATLGANPQVVTITATSTVNTSIKGTATLNVRPGINLQFTGTGNAMNSNEVAGDEYPSANWNTLQGQHGSNVAVVDQTGASSPVAVSWTADGVANTATTDSPGNFRMMRGYLDNSSGNATTVTLSGIPSGRYNIYVYTDANPSVGSCWIGNYTISATGITPRTLTETHQPHTEYNVSYSVFNGLFYEMNWGNPMGGAYGNSGTGNTAIFFNYTLNSANPVTITATPVTGQSCSARAPVNAIQIVPSY